MSGRHNLLQFQGALKDAIADPEFRRPMVLLMDGRMSKINPPIAELRNAVDIFDTIKEYFEVECHIVVTSTLLYGLSHVSAAFAQVAGIKLTIHRNIDDARRAAGLEPH